MTTCLALNRMHYSVLPRHLRYSILMSCHCCVMFDLALALVLVFESKPDFYYICDTSYRTKFLRYIYIWLHTVWRSVGGKRGSGTCGRPTPWILPVGDVRGALSRWRPGYRHFRRGLRSDGVRALHPAGVRLHRLQGQRAPTGSRKMLRSSSLSDTSARQTAWWNSTLSRGSQTLPAHWLHLR